MLLASMNVKARDYTIFEFARTTISDEPANSG
jgi:hypothetical protein